MRPITDTTGDVEDLAIAYWLPYFREKLGRALHAYECGDFGQAAFYAGRCWDSGATAAGESSHTDATKLGEDAKNGYMEAQALEQNASEGPFYRDAVQRNLAGVSLFLQELTGLNQCQFAGCIGLATFTRYARDIEEQQFIVAYCCDEHRDRRLDTPEGVHEFMRAINRGEVPQS
jgi:hypothetical protein